MSARSDTRNASCACGSTTSATAKRVLRSAISVMFRCCSTSRVVVCDHCCRLCRPCRSRYDRNGPRVDQPDRLPDLLAGSRAGRRFRHALSGTAVRGYLVADALSGDEVFCRDGNHAGADGWRYRLRARLRTGARRLDEFSAARRPWSAEHAVDGDAVAGLCGDASPRARLAARPICARRAARRDRRASGVLGRREVGRRHPD